MQSAARPRGILGGAILVAVGVVYLLVALQYALASSVLFVALGLAFVAAYLVGTRPYVYLVPGCVLLGFGLGLYVPAVLGLTGQVAALLFLGLLALGLVAVFLLAPQRRWPLVPAAIVALLAVLVAFGRGDLVPSVTYLIPVVLIAAGGYLLIEQSR